MIYNSKPCAVTRFLTSDTASAPIWLLVRLYLGYEWFIAGWEKVTNPVWVGPNSGAAVSGFVQGALAKTSGTHPDVSWWYAEFLRNVVLPNATVWSNMIAVGELLVGLGLLVGLFTGTAAFFGFFMNLNYLLAGTVSTNPILLVLALCVMLAHRVAGFWGLDYYVRPFFSRDARVSKR